MPSQQPTSKCVALHESLKEALRLYKQLDSAVDTAFASGEISALATAEQLRLLLKEQFSKIEELVERIEQDLIEQSWIERGARIEHCEVGGMTAEELIIAIESTPEVPGSTRMMQISDVAKSMLRNEEEFLPTKEKERMTFVILTVEQLGFPDGATTEQIFAKAKELGLELCPPDAGPHLRLHYTNQTMNEWLYMGMNPITDSGGSPSVFNIVRNDGGTWLYYSWATPDYHWNTAYAFLFRLPQVIEA
jgi:hypothetical protein